MTQKFRNQLKIELQETGRIKEKQAPARATKEIYNYWETGCYKA